MSSAKPERFSAGKLRSLLDAIIAAPLVARYCVAFSGGADSTALLAALAEIAATETEMRVRAVHVDHGLDPRSAEWADRVRATGASLGVPSSTVRVEVRRDCGASVEAAARDARYAALELQLEPGEYLLTAHHVDDQLETVFLQLARGAGVAGLAAMPVSAAFGSGFHLRPVLEVEHADLVDYLLRRRLDWIEDPMNTDPRFERGFLRSAILPILRERWPSIARNVARTAEHMAEAQSLLRAVAERDWQRARDGSRLGLAALKGLDPARAANLLRHWVREQGCPLPSAQHLEQVLEMMTQAAPDSMPQVRWPGAVVRRYRGYLYLGASVELRALEERSWPWRRERRIGLGAGLGVLEVVDGAGGTPLSAQKLPEILQVRAAAGGESLRPAPTARQRSLRNLFQEQGVVPWVRSQVPFVFAGHELIAVGNLWTDARFQPAPGEEAIHLAWRDGPQIY